MSADRLPEWRYVIRRTVALAILTALVGLAAVALLRWVGVDACAEDFGCLPATR